ncbi:MAG: HD domain-containing protein [Candidatus Wildermuthbacteria bacterium]|nr:HD domain-containing protein [Candidatus Wildermuthbacteria bacterium]
MDYFLRFLLTLDKLKDVKRRGMSFDGVEKQDSPTDHTFRLVMMVWLFGHKRHLNLEKAFKMALVHDLCKIYTGDITPYDLLPDIGQRKGEDLAKRWRRLSLEQKEKRYNQILAMRYEGLWKLVGELPEELSEEMMHAGIEYRKRETEEARFVAQLDMLENLLEALEQYKKNKEFPMQPWWEHAREVIDDPGLLEFLQQIEQEQKKE